MHAVPWKPIVVGVDTSPQAVQAAVVGDSIATAAGTDCCLVHAAESDRATASSEVARARIQGLLPPELRASLQVHRGKPKEVLPLVARTTGAGLLVIGGKRHSAPVRWFGGSTAHQAIRTTDIPVLIIGAKRPRFHRCLVVVDESYAAGPTMEMAQRLCDVLGGTIRVMHASLFPTEGHQVLRQEVRGIVGSDISLEVFHGTPLQAIRVTVEQWDADVVVVGSHGKGFTDRALLGSTTEAVLRRLPASVLVVSVRAPRVGNTWLLNQTSNAPSRV